MRQQLAEMDNTITEGYSGPQKRTLIHLQGAWRALGYALAALRD